MNKSEKSTETIELRSGAGLARHITHGVAGLKLELNDAAFILTVDPGGPHRASIECKLSLQSLGSLEFLAKSLMFVALDKVPDVTVTDTITGLEKYI